jgi:hypothetical protein
MHAIALLLLQVKENLPVVEMLRELAASYFKKGSEDRMNRIKGIFLLIYSNHVYTVCNQHTLLAKCLL